MPFRIPGIPHYGAAIQAKKASRAGGKKRKGKHGIPADDHRPKHADIQGKHALHKLEAAARRESGK